MEEQIKSFWQSNIKPLFRKEILNYKVETNLNRVRYVNFDNAATTSPFKFVENTINQLMIGYGSVHRGSGQKSIVTTDKYEHCREIIRKFVGASSDNYVIFTKNTTEAINNAAELFSKIPGKVLISDIEHSSNLLPWLKYNEIIQFKTNIDGTFELNEIENRFIENKDIKLITITGSSNVTGYHPPINEIAKIAHKYNAKIFVDVCQLIPHEKVNILADTNLDHIDFIAFSGHKMYAPYGSGVLIGPKKFFDEIYPYQIGGGNLPYITRDLNIKRYKTVQAHDPGTPNAIGAIAIASSIKIIENLGYDKIKEYESRMASEIFEKLNKIKNIKIYISKERLGKVISFEIIGMDSKIVADILAKEYGIGVRAGSFCTYELLRKLKNISDEEDKNIASEVDNGNINVIPSLIRVSIGLSNQDRDISRFIHAIDEISRRNLK